MLRRVKIPCRIKGSGSLSEIEQEQLRSKISGLIDFIKNLEEKNNRDALLVYTRGACGQLAMHFQRAFPEAIPYIATKGYGIHIITKIGNNFYDINGEISKEKLKEYNSIKVATEETVRNYSFIYERKHADKFLREKLARGLDWQNIVGGKFITDWKEGADKGEEIPQEIREIIKGLGKFEAIRHSVQEKFFMNDLKVLYPKNKAAVDEYIKDKMGGPTYTKFRTSLINGNGNSENSNFVRSAV